MHNESVLVPMLLDSNERLIRELENLKQYRQQYIISKMDTRAEEYMLLKIKLLGKGCLISKVIPMHTNNEQI